MRVRNEFAKRHRRKYRTNEWLLKVHGEPSRQGAKRMTVEIAHIAHLAREGIKVAYRLGQQGSPKPFEQWLLNLMVDPFGVLTVVGCLNDARESKYTPFDELPVDEQRAILVATEAVEIGVLMDLAPTYDEIIPAWEIDVDLDTPLLDFTAA
jgi:hypothetical protein